MHDSEFVAHTHIYLVWSLYTSHYPNDLPSLSSAAPLKNCCKNGTYYTSSTKTCTQFGGAAEKRKKLNLTRTIIMQHKYIFNREEDDSQNHQNIQLHPIPHTLKSDRITDATTTTTTTTC